MPTDTLIQVGLVISKQQLQNQRTADIIARPNTGIQNQGPFYQ
jgi:hypothetical protein